LGQSEHVRFVAFEPVTRIGMLVLPLAAVAVAELYGTGLEVVTDLAA